MKLVKQTNLFFQSGNSDKIYEVDLCEVSSGQYVVNFRYGRRGLTLREGTKTIAPVGLAEAEAIFEKLVDSKVKKGYSEAAPESASEPEPATPAAPESEPTTESEPLDPRRLAVLNRIQAGETGKGSRLSRAIWRAGELKIVEAAPLLDQYVGLNTMTDYCIAFTLGRLGRRESIATLEKIISVVSQTENRIHVVQLAKESIRLLADNERRQASIDATVALLPTELRELMKPATKEEFTKAFLEGLQNKTIKPKLLRALYFIDSPVTRAALLAAIETFDFAPPYFRQFRRIFKTAELRRDGQVFGLLAYRFETYKSKFRTPSWVWSGYRKPTLGDNPQHACGVQTREYFRRRVWKTLRRIGEAGDSDFVTMAVGTLLPFSDDDAKPVRSETYYDWQRRRSFVRHWDIFGGYWAFNHLLYRHSKRFVAKKKNFRVAQGFAPGSDPPDESEGAFPELWKREPRGLVHLLMESRCGPVHEFAARLLGQCSEFCDNLPLEVIKQFLAAPYEVTVGLGFDLALQRYDPSNPDLELVLLFANSPLQRARDQARNWFEANRSHFLAETDFVFALLTSQYEDTRNLAGACISLLPNDQDYSERLAGKLIAYLQSATSEDAAVAAAVSSALLRSQFDKQVSRLGEDVLCDLLSSDLEEVQMFAGSAILQHATLKQNPTERILRALLDASHASARATGVQVISGLPTDVLVKNLEVLAGLSCHEFADVRAEIRPVVQRLIGINANFAKAMASELIQRLMTPGAPEGVPTHTACLLREDLGRYLGHVDSETVFRLLQSRSAPAQEVGGFLLPTNVEAGSLKVTEIVKLASHDILTVRQAAWQMFDGDVMRMCNALATAIRVLDSKWDDTRQFGFDFLRDKVNEQYLTPDVLISICDSVRTDVQQFGREMITRRFQREDGPHYMLRLAEHPATDLQLFVSNFLNEYAAGQPERIEELEPYFVSILSRVNRSRVAKDRVLAFLRQESRKSPTVAAAVGRILARISATCAIGDRAQTIEGMLELHESHPDVELPLKLNAVEVR